MKKILILLIFQISASLYGQKGEIPIKFLNDGLRHSCFLIFHTVDSMVLITRNHYLKPSMLVDEIEKDSVMLALSKKKRLSETEKSESMKWFYHFDSMYVEKVRLLLSKRIGINEIEKYQSVFDTVMPDSEVFLKRDLGKEEFCRFYFRNGVLKKALTENEKYCVFAVLFEWGILVRSHCEDGSYYYIDMSDLSKNK